MSGPVSTYGSRDEKLVSGRPGLLTHVQEQETTRWGQPKLQGWVPTGAGAVQHHSTLPGVQGAGFLLGFSKVNK